MKLGGENFDYYYHNKESKCSLSESIKNLDKTGMDLIEYHNTLFDIKFFMKKLILFLINRGFKEYLTYTENTICGKYPLTLFLRVKIIFFINVIISFKNLKIIR